MVRAGVVQCSKRVHLAFLALSQYLCLCNFEHFIDYIWF